jgi:hypothetical protein
MILQRLVPIAMALGLSFTFVPDAYAVGDCDAVCGPASPCTLKCDLGGGFVTTCGRVGPCTKFPATPSAAAVLTGAGASDACDTDDLASFATAPDVAAFVDLVVGSVQQAVRWVDRAADRLASIPSFDHAS